MFRGNDVKLNQSIGVALADNNMSINHSFVPLSVAGNQITVNKSAACLIAAGNVKADNSSAILVLANKFEGNLTTILDWKSALAIGAVVGGIWGLFTVLKRR